LDTTVFAVEEAGVTKKVSALALKSYMSTTSSLDTSGLINAGGGITANSVSAGIIGNVGALLIGTIQTNAQPYITSLGTLTSLTVSGNSSLGNVTISGTLGVAGVTTMNGIFWSNGAVYSTGSSGGGGSVNFNSVASSIVPSANLTYNLGSTTAYWNNVYGKAVQAQYADLAENYTAAFTYSPGTVVIWADETIPEEITVSGISHNPLVAGVISTNPAYLMNSAVPGLPLALSGRVPCQVRGPVKKGDRLVNLEVGVAGKLDPAFYQPGCVIGHALETISDSEIRLIEVVIMKY
jgi:hypothetical protein